MTHPKAKPIVSMEFTATLTLSEADLNIIHRICLFGGETVRKHLARMTGDLDMKATAELFDHLRSECENCHRVFKATREAWSNSISGKDLGTS